MTRAVVKPSLLSTHLSQLYYLISMLAGTVYVFGLDSFGPEPGRTDYLRRSGSPDWD